MASGKRILIVEDEHDLVGAIANRLEYEGFDVVCAGDGSEGLDLFSNSGADLIILDMMMPVMDGFEFIRRLKGGRTGEDVPPIIVMTAYGTKFSPAEFGVLEGCEMLDKPFEANQLLDLIKKVLK